MAPQSEVGFRRVREDELATLKERLACHLPHSYAVHGAVSLAARYGLHALQPASILVPTGPRPSSFTAITTVTKGVSTQQCIAVFWSLEEHTAEDVAQHLSRLPDLDWSQPVTILSLPTILMPALQSLDTVFGWRVRLEQKFIGSMYSLQAPMLLGTELPPAYHMTCLEEEDASMVWTNWEFNVVDSEDNIRHDIAHFPSIAIRERGFTNGGGSMQEEAEETLVSWIRTYKLGWMGSTFTVQQHRRRGLAKVATLALAHQLLQEGLLAYVLIEETNTASIKFHENLGFKQQCPVRMLVLLPAETNGP